MSYLIIRHHQNNISKGESEKFTQIMPFRQFYFLFILFAILFSDYAIAKRKALGKVTYEFNYAGEMASCDDAGNDFFDARELKFTKDSPTTTVMGGSFVLTEPIQFGTSVNYDVYKLTESGKEPSWNFEIPDICDHVGEYKMPWSGVIEEMNLNPRACPIPEGRYEIGNLKLDMSAFSAVLNKDSVGEYEVTIKIYKLEGLPPKKTLISCIHSGYQIDEVREKLPE